MLNRGRREDLTVVSYVVPSLLFDEVSMKEPVSAAPKPPLLPSPLRASAASDAGSQASLKH